MFRFADPIYLLLIALLAVVFLLAAGRRASRGVLFAAPFRFVGPVATWRTRLLRILKPVMALGMASAILALARPQIFFAGRERAVEAVAVEMVVDVSGSMEALDFSLNTPTGMVAKTRLDVVKEQFSEFVKRRPDDFVGLVTFGGYATTVCPLTTDHRAVLEVLRHVQIPKAVFAETGLILNKEEMLTAIGDALATASARLRDAAPKSRIIVLLSDGESNTGVISPEAAAKAAQMLGIKIHTIGVGTAGASAFRARDDTGEQVFAYRDAGLDEELLQSLARASGGRYFHVKDAGGLEMVMEEIDALEKTKVKVHEYENCRELFPWFLFPAMALLAAGTALNVVVGRSVV